MTMPPSQPLTGKVVLITGAGSGIGRATSIKLAGLGAFLALSDIEQSSLAQTAGFCAQPQQGQTHLTRVVDVSVSKAVDEFAASAVENYGRIDRVFNCAGINPTDMAIESTTDDYWHKLMDTNLKGTFNVSRACIPHLQSGASVVNVSSVVGVKPGAGVAVYAATKAGVIGFSKSMALELGPKGIRTNTIAPGYIDTPTNSSVVVGHEAMQRSADKVAVGRLGKAEEVADVVAFLFDDASRYINGSVVEINGGLE
jgi:NAD(P)-dependent dehydrogenase (short-subunit alcohol dehydrogenase family)